MMVVTVNPDADHAYVGYEAAGWLLTMRGEVVDQKTRLKFLQWYNAHPAHRAAYLDAQMALQLVKAFAIAGRTSDENDDIRSRRYREVVAQLLRGEEKMAGCDEGPRFASLYLLPLVSEEGMTLGLWRKFGRWLRSDANRSAFRELAEKWRASVGESFERNTTYQTLKAILDILADDQAPRVLW